MVHLSRRALWFPDPEQAHESGVVAVGGDLSPQRLALAYRSGIFPWFSEGEPILWWSPDPRFVLFPEELNVRRSLKKVLRKAQFEIRFDHDFATVIRQCANRPRPGQAGTWITAEMERAYVRLHQLGMAHSVEVYEHDVLVGGLYGVAMGPFFFGESMFHTVPDASKAALYALVQRYEGMPFIDCQVHNNFFEFMGAVHVPRKYFLKMIRQEIDGPNQWEETLDFCYEPP